MFLGERWPDNGAPAAPDFRDRDAWQRAWDGTLELPYWTVHRERAKNPGGRGGEKGAIVVRAAPLRHPVPCFGYVVDEPDQAGRLDADKCAAMGLPPGRDYQRLKNGESVRTPGGTWIHPTDVVGPDRPGRRLCLLGDTCDSVGVAPLAMGCDVLVHESTFSEAKHGEAVFKGHSTSAMAGEFARMIKARNLLLTHFSNRYGTANTRGDVPNNNGSAGDHNGRKSPGDSPKDDDVDDDDVLPEEAPDDPKAAAAAESSLVEGLVREASRAKGDSRVVAASDFFSFNVQRRENFDEFDRAKGNREAVVEGPAVEPWLEDPGDARRRIDAELNGGGRGGGFGGGAGYGGDYGGDRRGSTGGARGGGGGRGQYQRGGGGGRRGVGGRGGYETRGGRDGPGGHRESRGRSTDRAGYSRERERLRGFERAEDGSYQRRREVWGDKVQGEMGDHGVGLGADVGVDSAELMREFQNRNK